MTCTPETITELKADPFRFSLDYQDLRKAYDVARLAGDYTTTKLILKDDALYVRTDLDGLECESKCKITLKPGRPSPTLAVSMSRSVLQELIDKEAKWETLNCKIEWVDDSSVEDTSHASTTWTFEFGRTHVMCPADVIPSPEPLTSTGTTREISAEAFCQTLRLLKSFVDPETKKNQFTSAFIHEGRAHASVASHARLINDKRLVWSDVYIGGRQINDLVYVLSRLVLPISVADEGEKLFFQAANGICKIRKGSVSADASKLESLSWSCSVEVATLDLNNAIDTICSQATRKQASVRVNAGPSHGACIMFSTEVPGGRARLRLPTPSVLPDEIDLIVPAASLSKLLASSVGGNVHLHFRPEVIAAKQEDAEVCVLTVVGGKPAGGTKGRA